MLSLRRPAPAAFLARYRAATDWTKWEMTAPAEGSRRWLVETCRAELDWAETEWRQCGGDGVALPRHGPHPAEALRLPHEHAAARLVNCHIHLDLERRAIDDLRRRLQRQREAASDLAQSDAYRAEWATRAEESARALRVCRARRALVWWAFRTAASRYRELRAAVDGTLLPAERAAA